MIDEDSNSEVFGTTYGDSSTFPLDALAVGAYVLFAPVADVMLTGTVSRFILLGPMILFVPGYVLLLSLFPAAPANPGQSRDQSQTALTVDGPERAALSIGCSVALLPVAGFGLTAVYGTLTDGLIPVLSTFSLIFLVVGTVRRRAVPEHRRFYVPVRRWSADVENVLFRTPRSTAILTVLVAACVVATVAVLAFGLVAPQSGTSTTNVVVGTGSGEDFSTSGYSIAANDTEEVEYTLFVENKEGERSDYTVVVQVQQLSDGTIVERADVDQFHLELDDGEQAFETHTADPTLDGESLRLVYLVYVEQPPADPDMESAYLSTYVWITDADANGE
ncbi:Membrane associated protein with extracellular Ig-like domain, a component of a putative secretion system [Halalkaliarchaeum sp. AArc-CO]|uniref:DUF1616 domain-containing protein n=1 Tax=unclassified Halalkaliarchaeum TaxID=2678344 RepID=UPI00217D22CB|nr:MULTISPECIES: DUF1616 domain-containing protein [unclassified Halalkaliarchaeum]MDR5674639.1 DUF1616 domain-containing protein [Halalkaliarchaeum sp. AArc-GB]UWG50177.1 Membrane associated protein with extracellular Ig-like domain, a component of a putative secretion system [Halalkaliarchaeum sp. AArc-CO]